MLPAHWQAGMAQRLPERQETWVREHGVAAIPVKSMNRSPALLRLLILNCCRVRLAAHFGTPPKERIHSIKPLSGNASRYQFPVFCLLKEQ
ncbi:hypothetical protein JaAD80_17485 [Janthinobacterium sp. AD80]|nr:hypothetical protein JaAD80_17485 [Janthinobacterium sp. AD80]